MPATSICAWFAWKRRVPPTNLTFTTPEESLMIGAMEDIGKAMAETLTTPPIPDNHELGRRRITQIACRLAPEGDDNQR